jgi:hypothetical protein
LEPPQYQANLASVAPAPGRAGSWQSRVAATVKVFTSTQRLGTLRFSVWEHTMNPANTTAVVSKNAWNIDLICSRSITPTHTTEVTAAGQVDASSRVVRGGRAEGEEPDGSPA